MRVKGYINDHLKTLSGAIEIQFLGYSKEIAEQSRIDFHKLHHV
jgi:hypothetical protein